ncbi:MAG: hypothetical protein MUF70_12055 [Myxococcota bacterium]|nr:hypothetical protein [Myxococcota bacterium]
MSFATRLVASLSLLFTLSIPAQAEEVRLQRRHHVGDSYALSLRTTTQSALRARSRSLQAEDVQLTYTATVEVLETDAAGRPLRERHAGAQLRYERPDGAGALFREGASFEVRRDADGGLALFANDGRVERKIEKLVGAVLATQFEYTLAPALLEPGRPVEIGETWELDPKIARRLLRAHDVRIVDFAGPVTATLARGDDDANARVIRYRIPIARWEPGALPDNARTAESDAQVEGEIRLSADPDAAPLEHRSKLVSSLHGVLTASGVAAPVPWSLENASASEQSTRILRRSIAANF